MPSGSAPWAVGVVSAGLAPDGFAPALGDVLGADAVARLRAAFLRDVLVEAASGHGVSVSLLQPAGAVGGLAALAPPGVALMPGPGSDLGEYPAGALRTMLGSARVAALLGAGYPLIPYRALQQAFEALDSGSRDIALGCTHAGGCFLIAVRADHPQVFEGIDWGTDRVYEQLVGRARASGLRVETLPEQPAIEDLADLERLVEALASDVELGAEATRAALRDLREAGLPIPEGAPPWRVEERQVVYASPWRTLVADRLETHAGETIDYAYLQTDQAVWVVPVTDDGRVLLIRQYRHPIGRFIVEVPAGGGEGDPEAIARRELAEETGARAGRLIHIASYYPASAHTTHRGHVYVALDIEFGRAELEATELLAVFSVPFELALDMARRGEIGDTQSALALLAAEPVIRAALAERHAPGALE